MSEPAETEDEMISTISDYLDGILASHQDLPPCGGGPVATHRAVARQCGAAEQGVDAVVLEDAAQQRPRRGVGHPVDHLGDALVG